MGDCLRNPDMGRTYQQIAEEGVEAFYSGSIADSIVADMKAHGGLLTKQDLNNASRPHAPLIGSYRGLRLRPISFLVAA